MKLRDASMLACVMGGRTILADNLLRAWETYTGSIAGRIWFGDGIGYVGPTVPPGVKTAFNVTASIIRDNLLFLQTDRENSPRCTRPLPDPTFLVVNVGSDAGGDVYLAHSAVGLTHDNIYVIGNVEGFLYPWSRAGRATGEAFLIPTEVEGTSTVRWFRNPEEAEALNATAVTIAIRNG
ncbi:hypothetical protein jhhlp_005665 [Lomentospora prolificans]|uniref:Uncharacterized protein n=1 Tax=Lomentospora prolificans TaxID=41688 RepID=A0A2N3N3R5_9PEZI|nr:hypothetical protein jhhlp_005665 [Lomentospora prolificans]